MIEALLFGFWEDISRSGGVNGRRLYPGALHRHPTKHPFN